MLTCLWRERDETVTSGAAVPEGIYLARPPGAHSVARGRRLAVKDLFDTAGLVTTYGSILFADHVPTKTAEAVRRLEASGWENVGKTNLHEFAYGTTSENPHFGTVPNPLARDRLAGGSSGGSAAALAAGLADAALGSDTGGSIRIPAACCGITGFKPSYGLVSLDGCFPLAPTFDHAGPMARDVATCTELLQVLAPGLSPTELDLTDVEVGVLWLEHAEPLVRARVEAASELFANRRRIELPLPEGTHAAFLREVADIHRELFEEHADSYGENVRVKLERCLAVTDADSEMHVGSRVLGLAGRTGVGDWSPLLHVVALVHKKRAEMRERRFVPVRGHDRHRPAVRRYRAGERDLARARRPHLPSPDDPDVDSPVLTRSVGIVAQGELAQDGPVRGPRPGNRTRRDCESANCGGKHRDRVASCPMCKHCRPG